MRSFPLAEQVDGINLLRSKGGASPKSLFDLKNGWVSPKRTINARPGSRHHLTFPAGTFGVLGFENKFHTFAATNVLSGDTRIVIHILRHPAGGSAGLLRIHRAFPFLGRIYVVAEFTDGVVQHYWLDDPIDWTANTAKAYGDRVQPLAKNGFYYANRTVDNTTAWLANTAVALNDYRQPTVANGFKYQATVLTGTAPVKTSNTEPTWPTVEGETVIERRYLTDPQSDPGPPFTPNPDGGGGGEGGGAGGGGSEDNEYGPFPPGFPRTPGTDVNVN